MEILRSVRGFISIFFQHEKFSFILPLSIGIKFVSFGWAHIMLYSCQVGFMFKLEVKACISQIVHIFFSKWPIMLHFHHIYHYDLDSNGPNKQFSCIAWFPCIWKKEEMFKCANLLILLSFMCHPTLMFCTSSLMAKTHQACHQNNTKCILRPHSHFALNFQSCPSTGFFSPWPTLHLITYTLYKTFITLFHRGTP